jgi:putative NADH-flavin reductase
MKLAIFGATGGTGRIMIRKALERGHKVTASARNPSSALLGGHERLRVVKADVMQPQTLEAVVEDQDAVITSISVGNALKEGRKSTTLFSEGTRNVIAAMERQGVGRLVCLSSSATL